MVSRIFIRFLGPCSVSKGFGSFLFVRSVDCDAPSGLSVPGVPRVPANGCGFSILKEAEKFLGRVTYGADSGWLLSLVDVSADDALPPFHSGGDSTRGYRRGAKCSRGRKRGRLRGPHEVARGLGYRVARHVRKYIPGIRDDQGRRQAIEHHFR